MRPNGRASEADEDAAINLVLYTENTAALWGPGNTQGESIRKNLLLKHKRGVLNPDLVPKLFEYLMDTAAKMYNAEVDRTKFTAATRRAAAYAMAQQFLEELESGGYDYTPNCHTQVDQRALAKFKSDFGRDLKEAFRAGDKLKISKVRLNSGGYAIGYSHMYFGAHHPGATLFMVSCDDTGDDVFVRAPDRELVKAGLTVLGLGR